MENCGRVRGKRASRLAKAFQDLAKGRRIPSSQRATPAELGTRSSLDQRHGNERARKVSHQQLQAECRSIPPNWSSSRWYHLCAGTGIGATRHGTIGGLRMVASRTRQGHANTVASVHALLSFCAKISEGTAGWRACSMAKISNGRRKWNKKPFAPRLHAPLPETGSGSPKKSPQTRLPRSVGR